MIVWILAILLLAAFGAIGYWRGAIRVIVSWGGLVLGLLLAYPFGTQIETLFPLLGLEHPIWNRLLGIVLAFFIVLLVFKVVVFLVHRKVYAYYQYRADDVQRIRWEWFNARLGACLGLVTGTVYLVIISGLIYAFGHCTTQATPQTGSPLYWKALNQARSDLKTTGMEQLTARVDLMPESYYQACDAFGLLYHNPAALPRFAAYPGFLGLRHHDGVRALANDGAFVQVLEQQRQPLEMINHPDLAALLRDEQVLETLEQIDFADLRHYIRTGESPKYREEPILGIWVLNEENSAYRLRQRPPKVDLKEFHRIRRRLTAQFHGLQLTTTPGNEAFFEFEPTEKIQRLARRLAEMEPDFDQAEVEAWTREGRWQGGSGDYSITLEGEVLDVSIEANGQRLVIHEVPWTEGNWPFVFFRVW